MTLIEKYGFVKSARVIQDFYEDVVQDPLLAGLFKHVSIADLADHQADVLVMVMGGSQSHTHRQIEHIHASLDISDDQFGAMLGHLRNQLLNNGFEVDDTEQIIGAYQGYALAVTAGG